MRVAYVCADQGVPVFGRKGCSIHVAEVLRGLVRRGASVEVFASRFDGPSPPDLRHVRIHRIGKSSRNATADREKELLARNTTIRHILDQRPPFDLVYERFSLWSYAAMEFARYERVPGLLEVNAPLIDEQRSYRDIVYSQKAEDAQRRAMQAASAILAVSAKLASWVRNSPVIGTRSVVEVVPNGVDPQKFSDPVIGRYDEQPDAFTIGFVGSLRPWHDLATLMKAFLKLGCRDRAWRLLVVGDGPERSRADVHLRHFPDDVRSRVTFTGAVDHDMVPHLLASMHVGVVPYAEKIACYFSPLKLFEYMAAGLPVVASRVGQVAEVIVDGATGLLYPPGNVDALVAVLEELRSRPDVRRLIGTAARRAVCERHTWDRVVDRILTIASRSPVVPVGETAT